MQHHRGSLTEYSVNIIQSVMYFATFTTSLPYTKSISSPIHVRCSLVIHWISYRYLIDILPNEGSPCNSWGSPLGTWAPPSCRARWSRSPRWPGSGAAAGLQLLIWLLFLYRRIRFYYQNNSFSIRVGPDLFFLPDAGYPAELSGMPCRIFLA